MATVKRKEEFVPVLKEVMTKFSDIRSAYLFGSYAIGRATPVSDFDIAVSTKERKVIPYLTAELSKVLGIPEEKISVLNIDDASPTLKLKILSRGVKLLDKGTYQEKLTGGIEPEIVDLLESERASFHVWLRGNPLDESLLKRILVQLSEDMEDLKEFLERSREDVRHSKNLKKAFERTVQTSIEGAIDLLRHIISGLDLGVAEYYKDYVEISRGKGLISAETAGDLLELIPTRHALVHRYREIDYSKLWLDAEKGVETILKLRDEVKEYLRKTIAS